MKIDWVEISTIISTQSHIIVSTVVKSSLICMGNSGY